jgi:glycosyl transferase family 25
MARILVINLAEQADRRASAAGALEACGLRHRFVTAFDGRCGPAPPAYARAERLRLVGKDLTPGEIGCYLSHLRVMELMLDEELDWAVIAEDDLVAAPDLGGVVAALGAIHDRLQIVKLECSENRPRRFRTIAPLTSSRALVRMSNVTHGAAGYFITRPAAERFLRYSRRFFRPVDVALARSWETGVDVLAVHPWPIVQDKTLASSMEQARFEAQPPQLDLVGASRWLARQHDSVAKRLHFLRTAKRDRSLNRRVTSELTRATAASVREPAE